MGDNPTWCICKWATAAWIKGHGKCDDSIETTAPPQTYAPPDSVCSSAITTAESDSAPLTSVRRSNAQLSGSSACWPTPDTMRTTTKSWLTGDYGFRVGYFG